MSNQKNLIRFKCYTRAEKIEIERCEGGGNRPRRFHAIVCRDLWTARILPAERFESLLLPTESKTSRPPFALLLLRSSDKERRAAGAPRVLERPNSQRPIEKSDGVNKNFFTNEAIRKKESRYI